VPVRPPVATARRSVQFTGGLCVLFSSQGVCACMPITPFGPIALAGRPLTPGLSADVPWIPNLRSPAQVFPGRLPPGYIVLCAFGRHGSVCRHWAPGPDARVFPFWTRPRLSPRFHSLCTNAPLPTRPFGPALPFPTPCMRPSPLTHAPSAAPFPYEYWLLSSLVPLPPPHTAPHWTLGPDLPRHDPPP